MLDWPLLTDTWQDAYQDYGIKKEIELAACMQLPVGKCFNIILDVVGPSA